MNIFLLVPNKVNTSPFSFLAASRTQQGRQREPSVKTLHSPFSAEFWTHYVMNNSPFNYAKVSVSRIG